MAGGSVIRKKEAGIFSRRRGDLQAATAVKGAARYFTVFE
jgi:hypothetical protein